METDTALGSEAVLTALMKEVAPQAELCFLPGGHLALCRCYAAVSALPGGSRAQVTSAGKCCYSGCCCCEQ